MSDDASESRIKWIGSDIMNMQQDSAGLTSRAHLIKLMFNINAKKVTIHLKTNVLGTPPADTGHTRLRVPASSDSHYIALHSFLPQLGTGLKGKRHINYITLIQLLY